MRTPNNNHVMKASGCPPTTTPHAHTQPSAASHPHLSLTTFLPLPNRRWFSIFYVCILVMSQVPFFQETSSHSAVTTARQVDTSLMQSHHGKVTIFYRRQYVFSSNWFENCLLLLQISRLVAD